MLQYSAILHNAIQYHVLLLDYYHIVYCNTILLLASVLSSMIQYALIYYNVIQHHNI